MTLSYASDWSTTFSVQREVIEPEMLQESETTANPTQAEVAAIIPPPRKGDYMIGILLFCSGRGSYVLSDRTSAKIRSRVGWAAW